jgi:hypothetical protein
MSGEFKVYDLENKELLVVYRKESGQEMKLFGTHRENNTTEYKEFIINQLKDKIKQSKFYSL